MKKYLTLLKDGVLLTDQIENGNTFFKRFKGLMGRKALAENQGYYLTPCNSIHTFSMRFPIDAVFLSQDGTVLYIEHKMKPWRVKSVVQGACSVLELPAAGAANRGITIGDRLVIQKSK